MEKFALLNLLKALETLQPKTQTPASPPESKPEEKEEINDYPNFLAQVIERHENISNRIKNNRR